MKKSSINACVALVAIAGGGIASLRPWQGFFHQRAEANQQIKLMKSYEKDRAGLLRQEARAGSPTVKEEHARALGYVRRGEAPASKP